MNWDDTTGTAAAERSAGPAADRLVGSVADREDQAVDAPRCAPGTWTSSSARRRCARAARPRPQGRPRPRARRPRAALGAPGLGKTTLSMIIAAEMGAPIRITSGPAIQHAGDLAAILSSLQEGEVLFLDEIHRMSRPAEEMLYMAMEDFRVDVIVGKGPAPPPSPSNCRPSPWSAPPRGPACCRRALRDSLRLHRPHGVLFPAELERVIHRSARLLDVEIGAEGAPRSPGAPAHPPHREPAAAPRPRLRAGQGRRSDHPRGRRDRPRRVRGRRTRPLDRLDRAVLEALLKLFGGGPVGLSTLAVAVGRSARRSRRSPSPASSYGRGCWPARPGAASPPPPPGPTWDSCLRRSQAPGGRQGTVRRVTAGTPGER